MLATFYVTITLLSWTHDLVTHKVFAGRDRDWSDVRGVIARQGDRLDVDLIGAELRPLLEAKGTATDLDRLHRLTEDPTG